MLHATTGAWCLVTGAISVAAALLGAAQPPWLLEVYVVSAALNAVAGWHLAGRIVPFKVCAATQLALLGITVGTWHDASAPLIFPPACAVVSGGVVYTWRLRTASAVLDLGLKVAAAALALPMVYPAQRLLRGPVWWNECVAAVYPGQSVAMVRYIYVPLTWAFAAILFGVTLKRRRRVSDRVFGAVVLGVVGVVVPATVVAQDVHAPATTQKLFLPCPPEPPDTWSGFFERLLDVGTR